ncbi:PBECR2 nuclease fold domain-containing protein [Bacillus sp. FJAT-27445]|uniref:PBECR3 domain-containing polyvalent protein n=1 Tax=Bacillus sp. FJAT-27445 TaxID=1679166 RepID=UPI0007432D26|nr:PBECR2 nuclease fold domain-containing protein [Bacillus sp. FJAT-27445]
METPEVIVYDSFNIDDLRETPYLIGTLTNEIITLLNLSLSERHILIWKDRIKYIEKHKEDFSSDLEFKKHIEAIPSIVQNPDYVGLHPKGDSLQFIKKIDKTILVAVRVKNKGKLAVRSAYPIDELKLESYLKSGTVKKF